MPDKPQILVSIGVPVFNGEKGLARALDSLLVQDYPDLEIIVSDNASTDGTRAICEKYVNKDSRIKYHRVSENRGAIWNFNRVFELSSGKYFMWAAHDDQREPSFVSACVQKMESCPDAVLCQAHTSTFVEGREELLWAGSLDSFEGVMGLVERYRETLKRFPATAMYGLYRSAAMRKTRMFQKSIATDMAFIQELSIHGDFVQVPKQLFNYRFFFGEGPKPWWYLPFVAVFRDHWIRVGRSAVPFSTKLRLWSVLIEHESGRLSLRAFVKASGRVCPEEWKKTLGSEIYWRWMHNPNVKAGDSALYLKRVIGPTLRWWTD